MAPATPAVHIHLDDKRIHVVDLDQEAASIIRLGGRDPKVYDLFRVKRDGVEVRIRDMQIVNLKDGDRFLSREKIRFTIDGEGFRSYDDDQTAAALMRLAKVDPTTFDLTRIKSNGAVDEFADDEVIVIHDGDEFVTAKRIGGVA
jgi:hypothetical protein